MPIARRILVLSVVLILASAAVAQNPTGINVRWLGQDGHDFVGDPNSIAPNGIQDVHLALSNLPPKEITFAEITGLGYDAWQYNRPKNQFAAVIQRKPRAATADIFFEATHNEKGRQFSIKITFDDQSIAEVYFPGGKADINLRMKGTGIAARWIGRTSQDHAGTGPAVGPDGFQDVAIGISRLAKGERVKAVRLEDASGSKWSFGTNPDGHHNAELMTDPKTPADATLLFQPERSLEGKTLTVTVTYEDGKQDGATLKGGRADARQPMPAVTLPKLMNRPITARWVESGGAKPGEAAVTVSGISSSPGIRAAVLSDAIRGVWVFRADDRASLEMPPDARPMTASRSGSGVTFSFVPERDESKTPMTLRLLFGDGSSSVTSFEGGKYDLAGQDPPLAPGETLARPGDDLSALASRGGTLRLVKGVYALEKPLVLEKPITVVGELGTVLQFSQTPGDALGPPRSRFTQGEPLCATSRCGSPGRSAGRTTSATARP